MMMMIIRNRLGSHRCCDLKTQNIICKQKQKKNPPWLDCIATVHTVGLLSKCMALLMRMKFIMLLSTMLAFVPLSIATVLHVSRSSQSQASSGFYHPTHHHHLWTDRTVRVGVAPSQRHHQRSTEEEEEVEEDHQWSRSRRPESSHNAMAILTALRPGKLVQWCVVAFLVSEALDRFGILEHPQQLQNQLQRVWKVARTTSVPQWKGKAEKWLGRTKRPGGLFHGWNRPRQKLATWKPKHQSALGGFMGLACSSFVWSMAKTVAVTAVAVYALSEANMYVKDETGISALQKLSRTGFSNMEAHLARVRDSVRRSVKDPRNIPSHITDLLDQNIPDGGIPPQLKWGFLWGLGVGVLV